MNDFRRINKITGIHWLKYPIENLQIKITLKLQNGLIVLPKFEDYANESNSVNIDNFEKIDEYVFKWQEKVFSLWETQRYSDVHNCISDTELLYHNMMNETDYEPSKIFTYIHEDYHLPLPVEGIKNNSSFNLISCFSKLNLNEAITKVICEDTISMGHLFRSEERIDFADEQWRAMHVVYDSSEYNEDSQLVYKQEALLLSLYHNITNNYLLISPDENNLDLNPYCVETLSGVPLGFDFGVEIEFKEEGENAEELMTFLKKLGKKWEKKHKHLMNFSMPPLGKKIYCITVEILSATGFEMDNLYIEFTVKVPEGVECKDPLNGRTHISKAQHLENEEQWNFGHGAELTLEMTAALEPSFLDLFFEVISTDWWGRHRTEGYSYLALSLEPGSHDKRLSCSRPEEMDSVEAESRRFFVGGCHLIKDLDVLAQPQLQDANFIYVTTGDIKIRWHVTSQTPLPGHAKLEPTPGSSSASAVLMGAEAVLRQYKKARARLAAATKDLDVKYDGSGDG